MMPLDDLLAYDRWANHRYLDTVAKLSGGQFTRGLGGSFGSIRATLVHLAWAEWLWTERWRGRSPQDRLNDEQFPTAESVRVYLVPVEAAQVEFFAGGHRDAAHDRIRYTNLKGEQWEYTLEAMVHHLTMHSAYHRGQLATLLRQLGVVPPSTDYLIYVDARDRAGA
jgi:uncharacterized damage-inducible protein DinB